MTLKKPKKCYFVKIISKCRNNSILLDLGKLDFVKCKNNLHNTYSCTIICVQTFRSTTVQLFVNFSRTDLIFRSVWHVLFYKDAHFNPQFFFIIGIILFGHDNPPEVKEHSWKLLVWASRCLYPKYK